MSPGNGAETSRAGIRQLAHAVAVVRPRIGDLSIAGVCCAAPPHSCKPFPSTDPAPPTTNQFRPINQCHSSTPTHFPLRLQGYGSTLGSILCLSVLALVLQALPSLPLQVLTILIWMTARFFMYASYFAIFGALFGFRNFGRLVAVDNIFNGLFGLLQYPLTYLAIHPLNGNFMWVNLAQVRRGGVRATTMWDGWGMSACWTCSVQGAPSMCAPPFQARARTAHASARLRPVRSPAPAVPAHGAPCGPPAPPPSRRGHPSRPPAPGAQAACLVPLAWFCWAMYKWEREDLVPIRPLEGEELPCDMLGHQERKKLKDLHLPHLGLGELKMPSMQLPAAIRKLTRSGTRERDGEV